MIDLYYWPTPNGHKITLFLEEAGLPNTVKPVDIGKGDQFRPEFLAFSPNNKIPAIIDHAPADGGAPLSVFESGAILVYLANKTGRFFGADVRQKVEVNQWLMWQMAGLGPMAGQLGHFSLFAKEKIPYAIDRYANEVARLMGVLEKRLIEAEYLAGEDYSIADMAAYPWVSAVMPNLAKNFKGLVKEHGHIDKWLKHIADRPAVQRGMNVPPAH